MHHLENQGRQFSTWYYSVYRNTSSLEMDLRNKTTTKFRKFFTDPWDVYSSQAPLSGIILSVYFMVIIV